MKKNRESGSGWGEKGHAVFVLFSVGHPFKQLYAFLGIGSSGGTGVLECTNARSLKGTYVRFS